MQIISRAEARAQGLKQYFTGKPCTNGHVAPRRTNNKDCVECCRARSRRNAKRYGERRREYRRKYYQKNREEIRRKTALYRENNRELLREKSRDYHWRNRDARRQSSRAWYEANRDRHNEYGNRWWRDKYRADPAFRVGWAARDYLRRTLEALGDGKGGRKTFEILGYTPSDLKEHLEKQFTKGMSWGNYGEWHIDHIIPVAEHIRNGETDPAVINCLTNLRPIWAADNMRKGDTRTLWL
jgi:hypothetical protein